MVNYPSCPNKRHRGHISPTKTMPAHRTIKAESQTSKIKLKGKDLELNGDLLTADGILEVEAAASGDGSEPNLRLVCYTGKQMNLGGWPYPVVVDLKGARFDKRVTPIIADHKTEKRVGHTTSQVILRAGEQGTFAGKKVTGPFVGAIGIRSSDMEVAKGIVADLKRGYPFQVSIGATVLAATFVDEGETAEVNGQTFAGPLVVATRSRIRELSVLVLGADNDTSTVIAARLKKELNVEFEDFLADLGMVLAEMSEEQVTKFKQIFAGQQKPPEKKKRPAARKTIKAADPEEEDDDEGEDGPARRRKKKFLQAEDDDLDIEAQVTNRLADEEERVDEIKAVAKRFEGLDKLKINGKEMTLVAARRHAIRERWTADQFELECRRAGYPDLDEGGPAIHSIDKNIEAKALECAILRQSMVPTSGKRADGTPYGLDSMYDDKTLEASHQKQYAINGSIDALLSMQIRAAGRHAGYLRNDSNLMAEAHRAWSEIRASGFSTINVVNVLENVMHKAALSAFNQVPGVWREICGRKPLNDFRPHAMYRLDYDGHFRKVAADGMLKHISMVDTKKTVQAETYGAMITIDRKTRRNDDLGLVVSQARGFGSLGALRIEETVFVLLLANTGSFFHSNNANLISGGSSALSITSLDTATKSFNDKVINGKPIAVAPSILLHGTAHNVLAKQLFNETRMEVTTTADTPKFANNPWAGMFRPVMSPYLNNTSVLDQDGKAISGQTATQWYLFATPDAPQGSAMIIGFLDGRETPYFDEAETQFSIPGGIQMRAYLDWGCAFNIPQLALKSAGA